MEEFMAIAIVIIGIIALYFIRKLSVLIYCSNPRNAEMTESLLKLTDMIPIFGRLLHFLFTPTDKEKEKYEQKHSKKQP